MTYSHDSLSSLKMEFENTDVNERLDDIVVTSHFELAFH